ncbi:MAG: carboxymuconolactone decarboxylase family protein [Janthinobacterium lividum]
MLPSRINTEAVRASIGQYADTETSYEERGRIYEELIGFLPPRIEARLSVTGALDPQLVDLQERMRAHAMYPKSFDVKTAQLMLFGMLLMDGSDAAVLHAIAARRAGASWHELQDTISLCFLFRGLSAANRGAELLANIAHRELQEASKASADQSLSTSAATAATADAQRHKSTDL